MLSLHILVWTHVRVLRYVLACVLTRSVCLQDRIVLFRPDKNADRLRDSALRMSMQPVPHTLFLSAVERTVLANRDYVS